MLDGIDHQHARRSYKGSAGQNGEVTTTANQANAAMTARQTQKLPVTLASVFVIGFWQRLLLQ